MVNASPDLRSQIEAFPELHPFPTSPRNSPIAGVLITNADLDHVLGLNLLREGGPVNLFTTESVREALTASGIIGGLAAFGGIHWGEVNTGMKPLPTESDPAGNLAFRAIVLPGGPPLYARDMSAEGAHSVAYQFLDRITGCKLLVAPDVSGANDELRAAITDSDAILFDGTFWSPEELREIRPGAPLANDMGHLTVGGGSLELLRASPARHKVYLHINNTNPILAADSPERRAVEVAGIKVGYDGLEFQL